jgi:hypothetical protein
MYVYGEIDAEEVDSFTRERSWMMVAHCAKKLGLGETKTRWFNLLASIPTNCKVLSTFTNEDDILGCVKGAYTTNEIWIRAGRSWDATAETVAHECRHLKQHQKATAHDLEPDCYSFAAQMMQEIDWSDKDTFIDYLVDPTRFEGNNSKSAMLASVNDSEQTLLSATRKAFDRVDEAKENGASAERIDQLETQAYEFHSRWQMAKELLEDTENRPESFYETYGKLKGAVKVASVTTNEPVNTSTKKQPEKPKHDLFTKAFEKNSPIISSISEQRKDKPCGRQCVVNQSGSCGNGRPCADAKSKALRNQYQGAQNELRTAWRTTMKDRMTQRVNGGAMRGMRM